MTSITSDRLEYVEGLQDAGISGDQARAHAAALDRALRDHVATKQDLDALGTRIEHRMDLLEGSHKQLAIQLRGEMGELRSDLRGGMSELRSDLQSEMAELRSDVRSEMAELRAEMNQRFTEQDAKFEQRFAELEAKITSQGRINQLLMAILIAAIILPFLRDLIF